MRAGSIIISMAESVVSNEGDDNLTTCLIWEEQMEQKPIIREVPKGKQL